MKRTKQQNLITIIALASAYFVGSDLFTFFGETVPSLQKQVTDARDQTKAKQKELDKLRSFAKNIEVVKQELRELDVQLEAALGALPKVENIADLLRKLNMLAENSGVELVMFRPETTSRNVANVPPNVFYSAHEIGFGMKGEFTQALLFLDQVARLKRIINLVTLEMRNGGTAVSRGRSKPALRIDGRLKIYRSKI